MSKPDLRYCKCKQCGTPMLLCWDQANQHFCAACENCSTYMPLMIGEKPEDVGSVYEVQ